MARAPLGKDVLVPLGQEYGKFIRALRGKSKKCLVLDCDNTLWGGVIGEDGLSGIKLGSTYPGSAYHAFQQEILNLYHRGVILALCSKNNEADVLEVFREHPDMLLKEHHFSTWQINWDDKATNLVRIAEDLNIGIDSFVFVDDSVFECEWVGKQLPQVAVLQLDGKISSYRNKLSGIGFFDALTFSEEDRKRSGMYVQAKERKNMLQSASSLEDYLVDLQLQAEIGTPGKKEIPRVSQLTQKTNQFNLTTYRYTEGEIQNFVESVDSEVYFLRLSDRISDLGIVGVVIVKFEEEYAEIDSFLFSCRALGRGVEDALLCFVVKRVIEKGKKRIEGKYLPTQKNSQVADFYIKHGFQLISEKEEGSSWSYSIESEKIVHPYWISVKAIAN
jgi:FkbH-like protein